MNWYKSLNIDQKIMLKELCYDITGIDFRELGLMFSFRERIEILYNKLVKEGFEI